MTPEPKPRTASGRSVARAYRNSRPASAPLAAIPEEIATAAREPLVLEWTDPGAREPAFSQNFPADAFAAPEARYEQDRIRMRRQISGKDVIEGAAQLVGLWPEGYTTDPCPRIGRNVGDLMTDGRPAGRRALDEELRRQRAACKR